MSLNRGSQVVDLVDATSSESRPAKRTWRPTAPAVLDIIGGIYIGFLFVKWAVNLVVMIKDIVVDFQPAAAILYLFAVLAIALMISVAFILLSLTFLAIAGGVLAIKRKVWVVSLTASIMVFLSPLLLRFHWILVEAADSLHPYAWISVMLLGAIAIILTALSKNEFE
jgi:hypothetical protein